MGNIPTEEKVGTVEKVKTTKKPAAAKTAKKSAAKKPVVKKTATKKPVVKKTIAKKKPVVKKTAAKEKARVLPAKELAEVISSGTIRLQKNGVDFSLPYAPLLFISTSYGAEFLEEYSRLDAKRLEILRNEADSLEEAYSKLTKKDAKKCVNLCNSLMDLLKANFSSMPHARIGVAKNEEFSKEFTSLLDESPHFKSDPREINVIGLPGGITNLEDLGELLDELGSLGGGGIGLRGPDSPSGELSEKCKTCDERESCPLIDSSMSGLDMNGLGSGYFGDTGNIEDLGELLNSLGNLDEPRIFSSNHTNILDLLKDMGENDAEACEGKKAAKEFFTENLGSIENMPSTEEMFQGVQERLNACGCDKCKLMAKVSEAGYSLHKEMKENRSKILEGLPDLGGLLGGFIGPGGLSADPDSLALNDLLKVLAKVDPNACKGRKGLAEAIDRSAERGYLPSVEDMIDIMKGTLSVCGCDYCKKLSKSCDDIYSLFKKMKDNSVKVMDNMPKLNSIFGGLRGLDRPSIFGSPDPAVLIDLLKGIGNDDAETCDGQKAVTELVIESLKSIKDAPSPEEMVIKIKEVLGSCGCDKCKSMSKACEKGYSIYKDLKEKSSKIMDSIPNLGNLFGGPKSSGLFGNLDGLGGFPNMGLDGISGPKDFPDGIKSSMLNMIKDARENNPDACEGEKAVDELMVKVLGSSKDALSFEESQKLMKEKFNECGCKKCKNTLELIEKTEKLFNGSEEDIPELTLTPGDVIDGTLNFLDSMLSKAADFLGGKPSAETTEKETHDEKCECLSCRFRRRAEEGRAKSDTKEAPKCERCQDRGSVVEGGIEKTCPDCIVK